MAPFLFISFRSTAQTTGIPKDGSSLSLCNQLSPARGALRGVYPLVAEVCTYGPNEAQSLLEFDLSQKADFSSADSLIWLETFSAEACLHLQKYLFENMMKN